MSKATGLGARFYVGGVDLSGDVGGLSAIGSSRPTENVTGIDKEAVERIQLLKNGRIDYSAHWNPDGAHVTVSELPTEDQVATYLHRASLGAPSADMIAKQVNYDHSRNADGVLSTTISTQSNGFGLEWGRTLADPDIAQLTSGSPSGAAVDFSSSTNFGLQAYLHVVDFDGTDVTIAVQDSANGSSGWSDVTGGVFDEVTSAPAAQRLQTARDETVDQFLRVNATGTFTSVDVVVVVVKNLQTTVF